MNIRSIYLAGLFAIIGSHIINTNAQQLRNPFDFPILLSGNFGELRSNHFHSGIDFKTQGVEGKPVHTVQEGYVSRISVSPWGYGNGLYITHPDGTTTVYGHLQKFSKKIANYVKEQQYAQESFNVNLFDGAAWQTFTLNRPFEGLYIPAGYWRTLDNFASGSVCMVLTSTPYSEDDYVREFDDFIKLAADE